MTFDLDMGSGELVPAILQVPKTPTPAPAALLLHGFSSDKNRMAGSVGRALLARNVASLAIDLPLHGSREGGVEGLSLRNPLAVVQKWRLAVREAHAAIEYLAEHEAIDAQRIAIVGYSLGAFLATVVAAENDRIRAVVLAAGGDLPPETPFASLVRTIADPRRAVRALGGRPLFMVNGRFDRRVTPEQASSLFDAASEPKELRWYEGGHWPPQSAIDEATQWLAETLSVSKRAAPRVPRVKRTRSS
jgi:predicted esterase